MNDKKREILKRINQAKAFYVYCVMDSEDVGHYFKTTKSDVLHWTNKYLEDNTNLENLDNAFKLRETGVLFIN